MTWEEKLDYICNWESKNNLNMKDWYYSIENLIKRNMITQKEALKLTKISDKFHQTSSDNYLILITNLIYKIIINHDNTGKA